ncbi:hypothetical protein LJR235_005017 [Pararhizobium sp. LjRoot235]
MRARDGASRYFISRLVKTFDPADLPTLLDRLSVALTCTCSAKHDYECRCRLGMSKIIGMLVDRFFESSPSNLDPARVWSWLKPLHFRNGVTPERSASVQYLSEAHDLRRSVQQLAILGVTGDDAAHDVVMSLYSSHTHAGIVVHEGDRDALSRHAFAQGLVDVWSALRSGHSLYGNSKGPNLTRTEQRKQSQTSRAFLEAWSRRERLLRDRMKRERRANRIRSRRRHVSRDVPSEINRLLDANEVASVEDLRALMVQELAEVQKWLKGSETDPLGTFYSGGTRVDENTARNRIVDRLQGRMTALGLSVVIERHMAGSNRCDITASAVLEGANRLLVTEVKGQWNKELSTAASVQLDQRYAIHSDAARQGVYLVLWYGNREKVAGLADPTITTPAELRDSILSEMPDELRRRVDVVVLDLSRPPKPQKPKSTARKKTPK